jgi:predicted DsbA family dithiol-disulfide isomerase
MPETARIDIVSDAICPWCYIGKRNLEGALATLAREGLSFEVAWHPFQLNPDMPTEGVARAAYRARKFGSATRSAEMDARVTEAAAGAGLAFRLDRIERTPNTVSAHRLAAYALGMGIAAQNAVVETMFAAYFVEGRDIGDLDVLAACAAEAGLDEGAARKYLASDAGAEDVRAADAGVRRAGLSGVPTFIMKRHVLFSGAMPADAMAEAFRSAWAVLSREAA